MTPANIRTAIFFIGPVEPEDCHRLVQTAFDCPFALLEGEKYDEELPRYEARVLGLNISLSAQETVWHEGRLYQLTVVCMTKLLAQSAPAINLEFHFASLLKMHNISLVFDKPGYAAEYKRREQAEPST